MYSRHLCLHHAHFLRSAKAPWLQALLVWSGAITPGLGAAPVTLRWADNSDNESGFRIERAIGDSVFSEIALTAPDVTTYTDAAAGVDLPHHYRVTAYNDAGTSASSNVATRGALVLPLVTALISPIPELLGEGDIPAVPPPRAPLTDPRPLPVPVESRLLNVSSQVLCRSSREALIPGFVVGGSGPKRVLLRGIGPALAFPPFSMSGVLPDPRMVLKRWDGAAFVDVASNDNWGDSGGMAEVAQMAERVGAFALDPASRDAAMVVDLLPGQYTLVVDDPGAAEGTVVVEIFDVDPDGAGSSLVNLSNRGFVRGAEQVMISGFMLSAGEPRTLLIRAVGPALAVAPHHLPDMVMDPMLELYRRNQDGSETLIVTRDNWGAEGGAEEVAALARQVFAFPMPEDSRDAALVISVEPGIYSVVVRGVGAAAGTVVTEVYVVE